MLRPVLWAFMLLLFPSIPLAAQVDSTARTGRVRLFLDCEGCGNPEYFRQTITWVDYVRDRNDANVHLLITRQGTGSGGREYTLQFIGLGLFDRLNDEVRHFTASTDTEDEVRSGLARAISLGLVRYALRLPGVDRFKLDVTEAPVGAAALDRSKDPWNLWLFRLGGNVFLQGESRSTFSILNGSLTVSRIADDWKLRFRINGGRNKSRFDLEDTTVRSTTSNYNGSALLVRTLSDHWSLGVESSVRRSTRDNADLIVRAAPGLEWSLWPYQESTRRALTVLYEIGVSENNYTEETIFGKLEETLWDQRLIGSLDARQPWGSLGLSARFNMLFNDLSKNSLRLEGDLELRVVRGLSLNIDGSYSRIRDQVFIPAEDASDEDVLLQLRQLQTSFRYFVSVGLSYTFGSVFSNIVNSRFRRVDG